MWLKLDSVSIESFKLVFCWTMTGGVNKKVDDSHRTEEVGKVQAQIINYYTTW